VRGRISDPTASVNAEIVAKKPPIKSPALWNGTAVLAQELPLAPGTNRIALTVTDAGNKRVGYKFYCVRE
jgi:hypothetical protein